MNRNFTSVTKYYNSDNEFCSYRVIENEITSFVPLAEDNTDYQAIQQWISEGNPVIDNGE
jgi:hypothetical protein